MRTRSQAFDTAAVGLSILCIAHCLLLPLLAVLLPLAGTVSEMEWVHKLTVLVAIPISVIAFSAPLSHPGRHALRGLAFAGAVLLLLGAFVEPLHDHETALTVGGALLFAAAHLLRLKLRPPPHIIGTAPSK